ncbi:hypothetical protein D3C75_1294920 [compost metagenome]
MPHAAVSNKLAVRCGNGNFQIQITMRAGELRLSIQQILDGFWRFSFVIEPAPQHFIIFV